jgi:hypothetical protein
VRRRATSRPLTLAMHFTSLIFALATTTVGLATRTPAKRAAYIPTFSALNAAVEASGYLTFIFVQDLEGDDMCLIPLEDV